jgi:hypothetical protein
MVKLAILLAIGAIALSVRWWNRRYDALGRARPFPYVSVGLLAVLAVGAVIPTYLRDREEDRLSSVASQLAGVHARVHCESFGQTFFEVGGELGFVRYGADGVPEHQTYIKRGPCGELKHYLASDKQHPTADEIVAVHVLTHESMHMKGITNEAQAECAAVQRDATTAELLGADEPAALALARAYWLTDYPRMPDSYRSTSCAPGGPWDEHLPQAPWAPPTL